MIETIRALRRRTLFCALFFVALLSPSAFAARQERHIDGWRPLRYDVRLWFNDDISELTRAETVVTILVLKDSLGVVDFDFGEMAVDGVKVEDQAARFERQPGRLNVTLPAPAPKGTRFKITVAYHGRPKDGLILAKDKDGNPSATGDNWPNRVHHWIPSLDHPSAKAEVIFSVFVPKGYVVVANGQPLMHNFELSNGQRQWGYGLTQPIPPYCMIVAVARFEEIEKDLPCTRPTPNRLPLCRNQMKYYVPPSDRAFAERGFSAAAPSFEFFTEKVSDYPYLDLSHIVGATRFGGMENSTAIVYPSTLLDTRAGEPQSPHFGIRRGLVEVVAHETAHQWFGDSVTPSTWADLWLSEGFATYFAGLFVERYDGKEAFRDFMRRAADKYLSYERSRLSPIYDTETEDLFQLLNANNYQKGAWVLHMLRGMLGDTAFFKGIRAYYTAHANKNASTDDLRVAMEGASGKDLKEFFKRWVYEGGHPRYQVSWDWQAKTGARGVLTIKLRQTQEGEPFLTPLQAEIVAAKGARRVTLQPTGKETSISIPMDARPSDVKVDPDEYVLKELVKGQSARQGPNLWRYSAEFRKPLIMTR